MKEAAQVPYYAHEGITARMERTIKRTQLTSCLMMGIMAAVCMALIQKQQ